MSWGLFEAPRLKKAGIFQCYVHLMSGTSFGQFFKSTNQLIFYAFIGASMGLKMAENVSKIDKRLRKNKEIVLRQMERGERCDKC